MKTFWLILVVALFALLCVPKSYSAPRPNHASNCQELVEEMSAMRKAQNQIILSLARNHDTFAEQLSDLSFELALYKKTVPHKAIEAMEKSAQAYRVRSAKAQETAQKLDDSTADLIQRIQRCLK